MKKTIRRVLLVMGISLIATQNTVFVFAQSYTPQDIECMKLHTCFYDPTDNFACGDSQDNTVAIANSTNSNDNLVNIYNWMLAQKKSDGTAWLTDFQAAAVVGNIAHESGGDPLNTQSGYTPDRTPDPALVSSKNGGQGGWGLIQWTPARKVLDIQKQSQITGSIGDLKTQVGIVWWHMNNTSPTGAPNMLDGFTQTKNVHDAVVYYEQKMEAAGVKAYDSREKAANIALTYVKTTSNLTSAATTCECSINTNGQVTVVLDPGHSGLVNGIDQEGKQKDPGTGLYIGDSSNSTERAQVWQVALKIKATLEPKGYRVVLTKSTEDSYVDLKQRALIANEANAAIAVSIHNTPGNFGDSKTAWVTPQKVGGFRVNDSGKKTVFDDSTTAATSEKYAASMLAARKAAGESGASLHEINFTGRLGLSGGNLSIVQLFSKVPWVYNETGQSGFNIETYAKGIANGIIQAVPIGNTGTNANTGCSGAISGSVVQTAVNYAWPTYHAAPYTTKKASYQTAIDKAIAAGKYVGGLQYPGVDCGGFVTRVMQDSGADPKYGNGGPTGSQLQHMLENPDKYEEIRPKTTADMRPGDIAINSSHTYMYVGPGLTDPDTGKKFESSIASASVSFTGASWRAPMAGHERPADSSYRWFRMKAGG